MARVRQVTRTILSTDAEVMTVNTATQEIGSVVVTVAGTYTVPADADEKAIEKNNNALEKAVKKAFAGMGLGEEIVMVKINDTHVVTKWYSMLESEFIKLAECKVLAEGEQVEESEDAE